MGALATAVHQGKALYAGISNYSPEQTERAVAALAEHKVPLTIHQPSYSMFNRHVEGGLLPVLEEAGSGCIVFSPLAQGLLTDKYLNGVPANSRGARQGSLQPRMLAQSTLDKVRALEGLAAARGQSLAQMSLAWALRDERVTSVLVGASSVAQLDENLAALSGPHFTDDELRQIDGLSAGVDINLWSGASSS